jgi:hypothetical protein
VIVYCCVALMVSLINVCLTAYLMSVNVYGFTVLANRKMCCELYSRRSLRDSGYDDYDARSGFKKRLAFRILTLPAE